MLMVPLYKEPGWLWDTIERWLKTCETKLKNGDVPEFIRDVMSVDIRAEVDWLKKRLESENSPVVFCHNDMQEGNILVRLDGENNNNDEPEIVVIDFEYCSYNYRAFDIANHFIEWTYDYTEPEYPFFKERLDNYPSRDQRLRFVKSYIEARGVVGENPRKILREVEVFTLASHFFWGIWGIINAGTSTIPFGYWEYAVCRLKNYFQQKERILLDLKPLGTNLPAKRKSCNLE